MLSWLSAWAQCLFVWWKKDRIRASRAEGKLLHLRCGDRLLIGEQLWTVEKRNEAAVDNRFEVCYYLEEVESQCSKRCLLRCTVTSVRLPYEKDGTDPQTQPNQSHYEKHHQKIEWIADGQIQSMQPEQITWLPSSRAP